MGRSLPTTRPPRSSRPPARPISRTPSSPSPGGPFARKKAPVSIRCAWGEKCGGGDDRDLHSLAPPAQALLALAGADGHVAHAAADVSGGSGRRVQPHL